jgi:hypothetical protein
MLRLRYRLQHQNSASLRRLISALRDLGRFRCSAGTGATAGIEAAIEEKEIAATGNEARAPTDAKTAVRANDAKMTAAVSAPPKAAAGASARRKTMAGNPAAIPTAAIAASRRARIGGMQSADMQTATGASQTAAGRKASADRAKRKTEAGRDGATATRTDALHAPDETAIEALVRGMVSGTAIAMGDRGTVSETVAAAKTGDAAIGTADETVTDAPTIVAPTGAVTTAAAMTADGAAVQSDTVRAVRTNATASATGTVPTGGTATTATRISCSIIGPASIRSIGISRSTTAIIHVMGAARSNASITGAAAA